MELNLREACFNPCYNGSGVRSTDSAGVLLEFGRFNPCYNGSGVRSTWCDCNLFTGSEFQSLL